MEVKINMTTRPTTTQIPYPWEDDPWHGYDTDASNAEVQRAMIERDLRERCERTYGYTRADGVWVPPTRR